jgi:hypothetical protein
VKPPISPRQYRARHARRACGRCLPGVRLRRGWRQQDVADRVGVSRAFVSEVERGPLASVCLARAEREPARHRAQDRHRRHQRPHRWRGPLAPARPWDRPGTWLASRDREQLGHRWAGPHERAAHRGTWDGAARGAPARRTHDVGVAPGPPRSRGWDCPSGHTPSHVAPGPEAARGCRGRTPSGGCREREVPAARPDQRSVVRQPSAHVTFGGPGMGRRPPCVTRIGTWRQGGSRAPRCATRAGGWRCAAGCQSHRATRTDIWRSRAPSPARLRWSLSPSRRLRRKPPAPGSWPAGRPGTGGAP